MSKRLTFDIDAFVKAAGEAETAMAIARQKLDAVWKELLKFQQPRPTGPIKS